MSCHQIDFTCLQEVLSELIKFPDEGNLKQTCRVGDIVILMWNFKDFTPCSVASDKDFGWIDFLDRFFDIQKDSLKGKGDISLPYFTLCRNKKTADFISKEADVLYTFPDYPDATESNRLEALRASLETNQYNAKRWDGSKTVDHYCHFSGGGDICIAKDDLTPVLVFVVPKDSTATDDFPAGEDLPATESPK